MAVEEAAKIISKPDTVDPVKVQVQNDLEFEKKLEETTDLSDFDISSLTAEQVFKLNSRLMRENAKRRIDNNKIKEEKEKLQKALEERETEFQNRIGELSEYEKRQKEAEEAEKTEVEKLRSKIADFAKTFEDSKAESAKLKSELAERDLKLKTHEREVMAERMIAKLGYDFSSDYERLGFMSELLSRSNNGEFKLNDEEVVFKVKDFVKIRKAPPAVPASGPTNRTQEMPVVEELKLLTQKKTWDQADNVRFSELIGIIEGSA